MARRVQEGSSEGEIPDPLEGRLLLSVREVAKALGVSRMTVYRLVKEGKLKLVYPTPAPPASPGRACWPSCAPWRRARGRVRAWWTGPGRS